MSTIFPIREITTYSSRTWIIMARVTAKTTIKTFNTGSRTGSVFSIDLLDKDGGEIRASFFNRAAEKFHVSIQQGKVYKLSKGLVKVANKKYSGINHSYELTFEEDAQIEVQADEDGIESIKYNFCRIRDLQSKSLPCVVDLIGVVREVKQIGKVNSKEGSQELTRRVITIVDSSDCAVDVTLWQQEASKYDESTLNTKPIIALKGVSVREYNGRACSTGPNTQSELNPNAPEAADVRTWWDSHGSTSTSSFNISQGGGASSRASLGGAGVAGSVGPKECNINEMRDDCNKGFLSVGSGLSFEMIAYLSFVSTRGKESQETPIYYNACATCNRKVPDDRRCVACDKVVEVNERYLLRAQFMDHTNDCYLTVFNDQALPILLNKPVKEFIQARDSGKGVSEELKACYWRQPWLLKVRANAEDYKGQMRSKVTVMSCEQVDYAAQARKMLKRLEAKFGPFNPQTEIDDGQENVDGLNAKRRKLAEADGEDFRMAEV